MNPDEDMDMAASKIQAHYRKRAMRRKNPNNLIFSKAPEPVCLRDKPLKMVVCTDGSKAAKEAFNVSFFTIFTNYIRLAYMSFMIQNARIRLK